MSKALGKIIFVVCNNDDYYHGENHYHLQHIILGNIIISFPDRERTAEVLESNPGIPVLMFITPCQDCRDKGVTGPTGYEVIHFDRKSKEGES